MHSCEKFFDLMKSGFSYFYPRALAPSGSCHLFLSLWWKLFPLLRKVFIKENFLLLWWKYFSLFWEHYPSKQTADCKEKADSIFSKQLKKLSIFLFILKILLIFRLFMIPNSSHWNGKSGIGITLPFILPHSSKLAG